MYWSSLWRLVFFIMSLYETFALHVPQYHFLLKGFLENDMHPKYSQNGSYQNDRYHINHDKIATAKDQQNSIIPCYGAETPVISDSEKSVLKGLGFRNNFLIPLRLHYLIAKLTAVIILQLE